MASCERCWADSYRRIDEPGPTGRTAYQIVMAERGESGDICTPEDQAGPDAGICPKCKRKTMHQYAHVCMNERCITTEADDER